MLESMLRGSLSAICWSSIYAPHFATSVTSRACSCIPSLYLYIYFKICVCRGHSHVRMYTISFRTSLRTPSMVRSYFLCCASNFAVRSNHHSPRVSTRCDPHTTLPYSITDRTKMLCSTNLSHLSRQPTLPIMLVSAPAARLAASSRFADMTDKDASGSKYKPKYLNMSTCSSLSLPYRMSWSSSGYCVVR